MTTLDDRNSRPTMQLVPGTDSPGLVDTLRAEDSAQAAGLSAFERMTCPVHRGWVHRCISSPVHVVRWTGHRWCARCQSPAGVAVDELTGRVAVRCDRCGLPPAGVATEQIVHSCEASLARSSRGTAVPSPRRRSA